MRRRYVRLYGDRATDNGRVAFIAADLQQEYEASNADVMEIADPLILHRAVYRRIVNQFNDGRPLSCRVTTFCDAPPDRVLEPHQR